MRRSKSLPDGGDLFGLDWAPIQERLQETTRFARECIAEDWTIDTGGRRMKRDKAAGEAWRAVYDELSAGKPGLLGMVLSRAEAQVMRVACQYALLDCSPVVRIEHIGAALACWNYCEQSARLIFGDGLGDPNAERLMQALKNSPDGLTRTQITSEVFGRNKNREEIVQLLSDLLTQGLIHRIQQPSTKGRPIERWGIGLNS